MNRQLKTEENVIVIDRDTEEENGKGTQLLSSSTSSRPLNPAAHDPAIIKRNLPIEAPLVGMNEIMHDGTKINRHANVELADGEFLRVVDIIKDPTTSEITLRGWLFRRTRDMNGLLERKLNEICWVLHIDEDDKREPSVQGMESIPIASVRKRRLIRMTNLPFPELSWRQDGIEPGELIFNDRVLVCRYKYICSYVDSNARQRNQWCEKALYRLRPVECDGSSKQDEALRFSWRGETVKGGSSKDFAAGEAEFLEQERRCHDNIQVLQNSPNCPPSRPSEETIASPMRRGSVGSRRRAPDLLQASEEDDLQVITSQAAPIFRTRLRDSSVEVIEIDPGLSKDLTPPNKSARGFGPGQTHFKTWIDLTTDDFFPASQASFTSREDGPKANCGPSPSENYAFPEVVEVVPPIGFTSPLEGNQRNGTDQISSSLLSGRTRVKHFMDQVQWGQHRPSKRMCTDLCLQNLGHDSFTKTSAPSSISGDHFTSPNHMNRTAGCPLSPHCIRLNPPSATTLSGDSITPSTKSRSNSRAECSYDSPYGRRLSGVKGTNLPHRSNDSAVQRIESEPTKKSDLVSTHQALASASSTGGDTELAKPPDGSNQQRYTFGDCFCGAGGTSRGAVGAGLHVKWGFDFNLSACRSYALNFYAAGVYNIWADQFAMLPTEDHKVDICHMSPPCQFFSDAHTVLGKDDDMNTASLFSVYQLLQKVKPRVVTLEQTSGLLRRHSEFFNAVVLMFTAQGFSIRWRLLHCADYGLPQHRVRAFMIASCPGEVLPEFPEPTHSTDPLATGLKPHTTINDAIHAIPPNWPDHDVQAARPYTRPPTDGDQFARCMTTSGAGMIHPSGLRAFTNREFAGLQGFPLEHKFATGGGIKRQIGNAVPPVVAKPVLEAVKRALMKADGILKE